MEQEITIIPEVEEQTITIEKEQGLFPSGEVELTSNGTHNVSSYATANVNVDFGLQDKEVSITTNGTTTITADSGYNGLNEVEVTTSVKYAPSYISFYYYTGDDLDDEINNLDTSNITQMNNMFYNCTGLTSLDCSNFDTSNVTNMQSMFNGCFNWRTECELDLSSFTLDNVVYMGNMFQNCTKLKTLDISNMDFSNVSNYGYIFYNCGTSTSTGLTTVYVKDETAQNWILNLSSTARPSTWTTANVIIKE